MSSLPSQGFCSLPQPEMQILCAETTWDVQFGASRGSQLHGIRARASSGHISELHHPSPAHRSDFGHQAFVCLHLQSTGCALSGVKGRVCFSVEFGITHRSRYLALSHSFRSPCCQPSSRASLGRTCSPLPAPGNRADDGAHSAEFLFLKNVALGKGFGPE